MSWNYRVMKYDNEGFGIHEVYYHKDGSLKAYSVNAIAPYGEDTDELREDMLLQLKAFGRPILTKADFNFEGTDSCGLVVGE